MTKYIVQHRRASSEQWAAHDTLIPLEGEIVIEIDEVNSLHKIKIGDGVHTYAELAYLQAGDEIVTQVLTEVKPRVITVELAETWNEDVEGKYSQTLTLDNITSHSRLDLQPDANMLAEFKQLGLVFVTENNGGTITVYSVGNMPSKAYTMQATIIETECNGDTCVVGIPIGTPVAQSDWAQTDETKADYIKNKPTIPTKVSELTNDSGFITEDALSNLGSDWNASEGEAGYVKNRTHYEEGSNVTLFDGSCYVRNTRAIVELEPAFILVSGKKYTVTLDGVVYEFETYIDEYDCICVGAPYNFDEREYDFTEIPLAICCYDDDGLVSDFACNVGGDHTLTVVENNEIIHRLDEKYIPHTIARIADIPTKTSELVNDSNFITSDALSGLSGAMRFLGTSATNIVDNSTTQTISVNGSTITAQNGNVVLYGNKEFVWNNTFWEELGDEGSHALKSVKIEGTGYLTGGGTLEANRTIDINNATKTKIDGAVQKSEAAGYNDILTKTIAASTYQPISIIKNTTTITPIEVKALMDEGKAFAISHTDAIYGSMLFTSFAYSQALNGIVASVMFETAGAKFCAQLSGSLTPNTWAFSAFQLAGAEDIPISLPNPNALTINGTTYDGSEVVRVGNTIHYIVGDSTTAGTWTGTCSDITKYYDGLTIAYKTNMAGISGGTTLNINGLGAISVRRNASTAVTTTYPVGSVIILTYSTTDGVGYWLTADYDVNTKTTTGSSNKTATKMFLIGGTSQSSSGVTTYSNTKCYIGTDNRLYSNGAVVPNTDEINALIDAKLGVIENGSY